MSDHDGGNHNTRGHGSLWLEAEAAKWRDIGKRETELRAAADKAAKIASNEAEQAKESAAVAAARESEAAQHNNWLQERVRELEDAEGSDAGARYGAELRRLREQLTADAAKAADELAAERAARRKLEALLLEARGDAPIPTLPAATENDEASEKVLILEAKLNEEREYSARLEKQLETAVVAKPARGSIHDSQDSWADALGLQEGDAVKAKLIGIDDRGKVKLSMRMVDQETGADISDQVKPKGERVRN